jgi:hypothetical protein
MFTFYRDLLAAGTAEAWKILLKEDLDTDTVERFGPGLMFRIGDDVRYHELGFLVAIPVTQDGKERMKYFLACKDGLTEEEKTTLVREIELLLGKSTHAMGNTEEQGWYVYDELYEWDPSTRDPARENP